MPLNAEGLTPKQAKFAIEYVVDLNATQAAIRAGYSIKTPGAIGAENLKKPKIMAAIAKLQAQIARNNEITPERIVAELAKIGFSNIGDFMDAQGDPSKLTRDQLAAVSEVTVERVVGDMAEDGTGGIVRAKFKLYEKRAALVDLGKHLNMFNHAKKVEHVVTGEVDVNHHDRVNKALDEIFDAPAPDPPADPQKLN